MYKAWNVKLPNNVQSLFKLNNENKYPTRKCLDFKVRYSKSILKTNCISNLGVKLWNILNDEIKSSKTVTCFKKLLKTRYLDEY